MLLQRVPVSLPLPLFLSVCVYLLLHSLHSSRLLLSDRREPPRDTNLSFEASLSLSLILSFARIPFYFDSTLSLHSTAFALSHFLTLRDVKRDYFVSRKLTELLNTGRRVTVNNESGTIVGAQPLANNRVCKFHINYARIKRAIYVIIG